MSMSAANRASKVEASTIAAYMAVKARVDPPPLAVAATSNRLSSSPSISPAHASTLESSRTRTSMRSNNPRREKTCWAAYKSITARLPP